MKKTKKLTLIQAISATKKPLNRLGDLICVQTHSNSELRARFGCSGMDASIKEFMQPETRIYLEGLYRNNEGWLESIEHFSDEELALHYDYRAGSITESGLAFNAGDPSHYEADYKDMLAQFPPERLTPDVTLAICKTILTLHKKYKINANQGEKQSKNNTEKAKLPRAQKNENSKTLDDVIRSLSSDNPGEKSINIWTHLKTAIREWSDAEVKEIEGSGDSKKYQYEISGKPKTISFGVFRRKLKK